MRISKSDIVPLLVLCGTGAVATWYFRTLWEDRLLFAILISSLLFSGAGLLPDKPRWIHGLSIGLCIGAFFAACLSVDVL
jgi:hypothetical protein